MPRSPSFSTATDAPQSSVLFSTVSKGEGHEVYGFAWLLQILDCEPRLEHAFASSIRNPQSAIRNSRSLRIGRNFLAGHDGMRPCRHPGMERGRELPCARARGPGEYRSS